ncbi:MAG: class I adenylate-forming enzyme family protein, partial [Actinomycetota bacterium]
PPPPPSPPTTLPPSSPHVVETYGCTESCGGVVYDGMPLPGVTVALRDDGRVLLGGPTLLRRFRGDDAATAEAFGDAGRLVTRDLGRLRDDGRLEILGRADDAIATGGETVFPAPVERALAAHPGVADVAVVGLPDPEWGERVVAFVVPRDPADPPGEDALRALARETLPAWAVPRQVVVRAELPRTPSGKVLRRALREQPR